MRHCKILILSLFLAFPVITLQAQTIYEFAFALPHSSGDIPATALLVDNNDGKGKLRIRYIEPGAKDSILAELDVAEEHPDAVAACFSNERLFYKLARLKYIDSKESAVAI